MSYSITRVDIHHNNIMHLRRAANPSFNYVGDTIVANSVKISLKLKTTDSAIMYCCLYLNGKIARYNTIYYVLLLLLLLSYCTWVVGEQIKKEEINTVPTPELVFFFFSPSFSRTTL